MLTHLRLQNFKSWRDTGDIALRPITGIFGANSSGKSALIHALLMLKQTAEASDRNLTLHFGGPNALVDLGDFASVVHQHDRSEAVELSLGWASPSLKRRWKRRRITGANLEGTDDLEFTVRVDQREHNDSAASTELMTYHMGEAEFGMRRRAQAADYELQTLGVEIQAQLGESLDPGPLPRPVKCYGFPAEARHHLGVPLILSDLALELERCLGRIYYLGPLRAQPERTYRWSGARPSDVGRAGEMAVDAMLGSRSTNDLANSNQSKLNTKLELRVAELFKQVGLLHEFRVEQIGENPLYQVKVTQSKGGAEALITDVGFGVSQILPVLVLCFYAPKGSTIILEQPEIHLHPAVQSALGDVLIAARQRRDVQIIVESHSEHLLRRLQRHIAEETLPQSDLGVYFCENDGSESKLTTLELDIYGNIKNWPTDFFGNDFGEIAETHKAILRRKGSDAAG